MGQGPSSFKESDVKRAVRAVTAAGQKVVAVEVDGSRITIKVKDRKCAADNKNDDNDNTNPWDAIDLK